MFYFYQFHMKPQWICRRNTRYFSNSIRYLKSETKLVHSDSIRKAKSLPRAKRAKKMRRHLYEENNNNTKKSTFEEQTSIIH